MKKTALERAVFMFADLKFLSGDRIYFSIRNVHYFLLM